MLLLIYIYNYTLFICVNEVCRDLVALLLCCLFEDNANLELSVITVMFLLVLWLAHTFGICRVSCLIVECGGGVMFRFPIVTRHYACDFLKSLVVYCDSTLP
jgi:hypothetical protein